MKADEARQIAMVAKNNADDQDQKDFVEIIKQATQRIHEAASKGLSKVTIDLRDTNVNQRINKMLDRVQSDLQHDGFAVDYFLTRTPNGKREMTISWQ
jgi:FKBP-type peptidyl-prolyl cis-trans isomerase (trigger factor)